MTSPIAPGDFVECVKTGDGVVSGSVYQVNRFSHSSECDNCGVTGPGLWLMGFEDYPFCPSQFKPIYRPSASLLTSLLNADVLSSEDALEEWAIAHQITGI